MSHGHAVAARRGSPVHHKHLRVVQVPLLQAGTRGDPVSESKFWGAPSHASRGWLAPGI